MTGGLQLLAETIHVVLHRLQACLGGGDGRLEILNARLVGIDVLRAVLNQPLELGDAGLHRFDTGGQVFGLLAAFGKADAIIGDFGRGYLAVLLPRAQVIGLGGDGTANLGHAVAHVFDLLVDG